MTKGLKDWEEYLHSSLLCPFGNHMVPAAGQKEESYFAGSKYIVGIIT